MRSLGYWNYDEAFLEANRARLHLPPEDIERDPVCCAEVGGMVVGISHLVVLNEDEVSLHHLFIEPAFIGQGIGKLLWRHAVEQVAALGAHALIFGADPNARLFYEHYGCCGRRRIPFYHLPWTQAPACGMTCQSLNPAAGEAMLG